MSENVGQSIPVGYHQFMSMNGEQMANLVTLAVNNIKSSLGDKFNADAVEIHINVTQIVFNEPEEQE